MSIKFDFIYKGVEVDKLIEVLENIRDNKIENIILKNNADEDIFYEKDGKTYIWDNQKKGFKVVKVYSHNELGQF